MGDGVRGGEEGGIKSCEETPPPSFFFSLFLFFSFFYFLFLIFFFFQSFQFRFRVDIGIIQKEVRAAAERV